MRRALPILVLMLVFIAACQQAKPGAMEKPADVPAAATGDAAVDSVGNGISNVDNVEKDLSSDELNDLDSGFEDVQSI